MVAVYWTAAEVLEWCDGRIQIYSDWENGISVNLHIGDWLVILKLL